MSIKLPAYLIPVALALLLLLAVLLLGFTVIHAMHPTAWHVLAVNPDVISNSH